MRATSISCLLRALLLGIPQNLGMCPDQNRAGDLSVFGMTLSDPSHTDLGKTSWIECFTTVAEELVSWPGPTPVCQVLTDAASSCALGSV